MSTKSVLQAIEATLKLLPATPRQYLWLRSYDFGPVTVHYHEYDLGVTVTPLFDPSHQKIYEIAYRIPLIGTLGYCAGPELLTQHAFVMLAPFAHDEFLRKQGVRFNSFGELQFPHNPKEVEEYVASLSWDNIDQATIKLAYCIFVKRDHSYSSLPKIVVDPILFDLLSYFFFPIGERVSLCKNVALAESDGSDKDTIYLSPETLKKALSRSNISTLASLCKVAHGKGISYLRYNTPSVGKNQFWYFTNFRKWPFKQYLPVGIASVCALYAFIQDHTHQSTRIGPLSLYRRDAGNKKSYPAIARYVVLEHARAVNEQIYQYVEKELVHEI